MGAALFIVLEKNIPGFDATVNGKALSRAAKGLDRIAEKLGVTQYQVPRRRSRPPWLLMLGSGFAFPLTA